ncbi:hypothetical protein CLAFUW4_10376 [Fulvia fulva]|nr:hypothetical protein CLAFUR4_10380 [Fulvia fulva]WPV19088.1 hypothetical protein CLAFUW4_10376 [Fulvia fulva]WPV34520.1 hypothetical protein CLAFUW7_10376 [Fulvia fulva]
MPKGKLKVPKGSNKSMMKKERKLLAFLQQDGQLRSDAELHDLLRWGNTHGFNTRLELRQLINGNLPQGTSGRCLDDLRLKPVYSERVLLDHLRSTWRLPANANRQSLLEWGQLNGRTTWQSLRQLGNDIVRGDSSLPPPPPAKRAPAANTLPSASAAGSLAQHKLRSKITVLAHQACDLIDCENSDAAAMNWTKMASDMTPSDLAILTHLQLIGQLPLQANLQSLLALGRECEFSRNALREAGNEIRFGEPCESQEAYRERLGYLARQGVECMRSALQNETPGVDGKRIAAIEFINRFKLDEQEPGQHLWRQTSTRDEDLVDYKYPSAFTTARLDNAYQSRSRPLDAPASPLMTEPWMSPRQEPLLQPDMSLHAAGDQMINDQPASRSTAQHAWPEHMKTLAQSFDETDQDEQTLEERENRGFTVDDLTNFDAVQTKRFSDLHELDPMRRHGQQQALSCFTTAGIAKHKRSSLFALPDDRNRDGWHVDAGDTSVFENNLASELENGVFVQYDRELDLPARLHVTNGKLLDDMDIDGV